MTQSFTTRDYYLLFFVLLFSVLLAPRQGTTLTGVSVLYVEEGLHIFERGIDAYFVEDSPIRSTRGPLFSLLIAGSFAVFGVSIKSAYLVTRLFLVLDVVIVFLLARCLYGRFVAIVASLITLSTYGFHFVTGFLNLDTVIVFFRLAFLFFYLMAIQKREAVWFWLAGATLGFGFLTKETALVFVPVALIFPFLVETRRRTEILRKTLLVFVAAGVVVLPWSVYIYLTQDSLSPLLGAASPDLISDEFGMSGGTFLYQTYIRDLFPNLLDYYRFHLAPFFPLPAVYLLSWLLLVGRTIGRNGRQSRVSDLVIVLAGFMCLPVLVAQAELQDRPAQQLEFVLLSHVGIAEMFRIAGERLTKVLRSVPVTGATVYASALSGAFLLYLWLNPWLSTRDLLIGRAQVTSGWKSTFSWSAPLRIEGRLNESVVQAAGWLSDNVGKHPVVASSPDIVRALRLASGLGFDPSPLNIETTSRASDIQSDRIVDRGKLIFAIPHYKMFQSERFRYVVMVFEGDLVRVFKETHATHVVLGERAGYLSLYLDSAPWAHREFVKESTWIYRIEPSAVKGIERAPLVVPDNYRERMQQWRESFPTEYSAFQAILLRCGFKQDSLSDFTYSQMQKAWIHSHLPRNARIAFTYQRGVFALDPERKADSFNTDQKGLSFLTTHDYLFVHNSRRIGHQMPAFFAELEHYRPVRLFPTLFGVGEGWEIYDLRGQ